MLACGPVFTRITPQNIGHRGMGYRHAQFPNVLWLSGVAGSGKSTISTTVSDSFRVIDQLGNSTGASDVNSGGNNQWGWSDDVRGPIEEKNTLVRLFQRQTCKNRQLTRRNARLAWSLSQTVRSTPAAAAKTKPATYADVSGPKGQPSTLIRCLGTAAVATGASW
jgi:hypothetical protein